MNGKHVDFYIVCSQTILSLPPLVYHQKISCQTSELVRTIVQNRLTIIRAISNINEDSPSSPDETNSLNSSLNFIFLVLFLLFLLFLFTFSSLSVLYNVLLHYHLNIHALTTQSLRLSCQTCKTSCFHPHSQRFKTFVFSPFALYMLPSRPRPRPRPQPSVLQVVVGCVGSLDGRLPRSSCS